MKYVTPEFFFRKIKQTVIWKGPFFIVCCVGSYYLSQSQPSTIEDVSRQTVETRDAYSKRYCHKQMGAVDTLFPIHGTRYKIKIRVIWLPR
jgi:hypothetical protein